MREFYSQDAEEYQRAIEVFMVELNHVCMNASERDFQVSPRLEEDIASCIAELREPDNGRCQMLRIAFALVDEFVFAHQRQIAEAAYAAYRLDHERRNGQSQASG